MPKKPKKAKKTQRLVPTPLPEEVIHEKAELKKTESEIGIKKPEYVCLVHRGEIVGDVYICPTCQSLYCPKCAKSLKVKGETCWSCHNELSIAVSSLERKIFMEKSASEILGDIIKGDPPLREAIDSDRNFKEIPGLHDHEFTLLRPEELEKIDLLYMSYEEKLEFIKEILSFNIKERKKIIDDILKQGIES